MSESCIYIKVGDCKENTIMQISSSVGSLASRHFTQYSQLQTLTFEEPAKCTTLTQYAFTGLTHLSGVTLPTSLKTIEGYCFQGCSSLEAIEFPPNELIIRSLAFFQCSKLKDVTFPDSGHITIEQLAFYTCPLHPIFEVKHSIIAIKGALTTSLNMVEYQCINHPLFDAQDGVLFSKELKTLIAYPVGRIFESYYTIPQEVEEIGSYAFHSSTINITFPSGMDIQRFSQNCFANWAGIEMIFPDDFPLKTIETSAFASASKLQYFTITQDLETINQGAFQYSKIMEFRLGPSGSANFQVEEGVLMTNATTITLGPTGITEYYVESKITTITNGAFYRSSLEYIFFARGSNLFTIGSNVFVQSPLVDVDFDLNCPLIEIGSQAFYLCAKLTTFTFPHHVSLPSATVFTATGISSFALPNDHAHLAVKDGVLYSKNFERLICYPPQKPGSDLEVPLNVAHTENSCFLANSYLKTVHIPVGSQLITLGLSTFTANQQVECDLTNALFLDTIGQGCFQSNQVMTRVKLPDSVTTIGHGAFQNMASLSYVRLPEKLSSLGQYVFRNCPKLKHVIFNQYCPLNSIQNQAFSGTIVEHLLVPWRVQSVAVNAFSQTIVSLTFISKPRNAVLNAFNHPTLKYIYVPCECQNWNYTIDLVSKPQIIVMCSTVHVGMRVHYWKLGQFVCILLVAT